MTGISDLRKNSEGQRANSPNACWMMNHCAHAARETVARHRSKAASEAAVNGGACFTFCSKKFGQYF
jgi:hypothetical protein